MTTHRERLAAKVPGLDGLWRLTTGHPAVRVAVLDGPVDSRHPALRGTKLAVVQGAVPAAPRDDAATAHGTAVASLVFGIAPRCSGIVVPVFSCDADGASLPCSQRDLARGILLALQHGARVINISGGEIASGGRAVVELADAVRRCEEAGVLVVAAAGNDAGDRGHVPALLRTVLAVGAMKDDGAPLPISNWASAYRGHALLAPGSGLPVGSPGGGWTVKEGTSFSAAVVSGVAALLLSLRGHDASAARVRRALVDSAPARRLHVSRAIRTLNTRTLNKGGSPMTEFADSSPIPQLELSTLPDPPEPAGVLPSDAGCGCGGSSASDCSCAPAPCAAASPSLVYALGQIRIDFASEARRDSLIQTTRRNIADPAELLAALEENESLAASVTWTLNINGAPVYAVIPGGAFAHRAYERLRGALAAQLREGLSRTSLPGIIIGSTALASGYRLPVVHPDARGIFTWTTDALASAVSRPEGEDDTSGTQAGAVGNFLERVYYEIRNLGVAPQERAINFAATNAWQVGVIFRDALQSGLQLDSIGVERSPICRPSSDCWDVKLTFFAPLKRLEQARLVYRFTVDVSDTVPVLVGDLRSWHVY